MVSTPRRMSLESFLALHEFDPGLELIDGVVVQKVSPSRLHGLIQPHLATRIDNYARPRRLARAFSELRTRVGRDSLLPDVAVYRWDRVARSPSGRVLPGSADEAPDIAIEIRSPEQTVEELVAKCRRYLANGTAIALVVVPETETVRRLGRDGTDRTLGGDDLIDLEAVLPGLRLTVAEIFAPIVDDA